MNRKHTCITKSPVLRSAAASGVFFSPKRRTFWGKNALVWQKTLFVGARRPPAAFFLPKNTLFEQNRFLEESRSLIYRKTHLKCEIMSPSADPPDPPDPVDPGDPVHGLPLGTSPTRAGGQDDVSSKQTPSNHRCPEFGLCAGTLPRLSDW